MSFRFGNYLTLKVCTCRQEAGVAAQSTNEVAVARHIRAANIKHPGKRYFRLIIREFTIYGPGGEHRCLLYMPQGMTYTEFRNSQPDRMLNKTLLQQTYQLILIGLDLLHQLSVVHTGMILCHLRNRLIQYSVCLHTTALTICSHFRYLA